MKKAILFSTGCPKCEILKKKLDAKGIPYTENRSVDDMTALGIEQVPVLGVLHTFAEANEWINNQ